MNSFVLDFHEKIKQNLRLNSRFILFLLITVLVINSADFIIAQVNCIKYSGNHVLNGGPSDSLNRNVVEECLYNTDSSRFEVAATCRAYSEENSLKTKKSDSILKTLNIKPFYKKPTIIIYVKDKKEFERLRKKSKRMESISSKAPL